MPNEEFGGDILVPNEESWTRYNSSQFNVLRVEMPLFFVGYCFFCLFFSVKWSGKILTPVLSTRNPFRCFPGMLFFLEGSCPYFIVVIFHVLGCGGLHLCLFRLHLWLKKEIQSKKTILTEIFQHTCSIWLWARVHYTAHDGFGQILLCLILIYILDTTVFFYFSSLHIICIWYISI